MKHAFTLTLIAALAVALMPTKAQAGDADEILGGIIGGLIIGEILDDDNRRHVSSSVRVSYGNHRFGRHSGGGGYYRYETCRRWIPGRWVWRYDDCGTRYRFFKRGYYTYEKRKVWVPHYRGKRHHYGHYDRDRYDRYDRRDRRDRYDRRDYDRDRGRDRRHR